jgi:quercetin dioxygenase-like cupin family protein
MSFVSQHNSPVFELPGITFTGLTSPSRGSSENAVWRFVIQPGTPGMPHRITREETLVALRGCARIEVAGVTHDLTAGSAIAVPANTTMSLANPGTEPFHAIAVLPVGGQAVIGDEPAFTPPWAV